MKNVFLIIDPFYVKKEPYEQLERKFFLTKTAIYNRYLLASLFRPHRTSTVHFKNTPRLKIKDANTSPSRINSSKARSKSTLYRRGSDSYNVGEGNRPKSHKTDAAAAHFGFKKLVHHTGGEKNEAKSQYKNSERIALQKNKRHYKNCDEHTE